MDIREFEAMLVPAREHIDRLRVKSILLKTVNLIAKVMVIGCLAIAVYNYCLAGVLQVQITGRWILTTIIGVLVTCVIWVALKCRYKTEIALVIAELDRVTNRHNMIFVAYEFVKSKRSSLFAQLAIARGIGKLQSVMPTEIHYSMPAINKFMLMLTIAAVYLSLASVHDDSGLNRLDCNEIALNNDYNMSSLNTVYNADITSENKLNNTVSQTAANMGSYGSSLTFILTTQMSSASRGGAAASNNNISRLKKSKQSHKHPDNSINNTLNKTFAAGVGSGLTPPVETMIKVSEMSVNVGLQEDQLDAKVKDNSKQGELANNSRYPFTDDRSPAPGRELGRSGKKGKPGNGRGGLGSIKKSRSTAALFPGQMLTVHVPSRPGKGKSKSFETETSFQSQDNVEQLTVANGYSLEGQVDIRPVNKSLKIITKQYFEELNAYSNRMLRESQNEN